ncbi:MAG: alpha/beta hydrolase [Armatimonadetes bacterium]|nr:alpha/beta hydrolase [Armatimonadota bacterium]
MTVRNAVAVAFAVAATVAGSAGAQERFLSVGDVQLRYEVAGDGPAVVLLHGWANSMEAWHYTFPALASEYRVVTYDRRGFGRSGGSPDGSLDPVDLRALLDSLGIAKAVVIGHSQGAASALRFALAYPDRLSALVLFGCPAPSGFGLRWSGPDAFPAEMGQVARDSGLDAMRALFAGHPVMNGFIPGTEGSRIGEAVFAGYDGRDLLDPKPTANATPAATMADLAKIAAPTLVITGELEMPFFRIVSDALAYGIRGAHRVVVPGGGHSVQLQQPERFNEELRAFLVGVPR